MPEVSWVPRGEWDGEPDGSPLALPPLIWQILYHRGLRHPFEIESLLSPSLKDLANPFTLHDMDVAVARLIKAFEQNECVCVYGDFDLDGTSGLALLTGALKELGFKKVKHYQPRRLSEGYGLHAAAVEKLRAENVDVLITVDVGITANHAVSVANEIGLDVIITDHHLPKAQLPQALAVINPNKGHCPSGLCHLSGVGVGFYLALALKMELQAKGLLKSAPDPKKWLDCFVIGTLTDLVPLVRENRVLVKHGLVELAHTRRPGLKALLAALGLDGRPLTSQDVAIRFAPKLNALSRLELDVLPLDVFLVDNKTQAEALIEKVLASNELRLNYQAKAESIALEMAQETGPQGFLWLWSKHFHQGVVGLVATKLAQRFGVPAFIGAEHPDGRIVGSARAPSAQGHNLLSALEAGKPYLEKFGGHAPAAGFELVADNAEAFKHALSDFYQEDLTQQNFSPLSYDAEAKLEDLNLHFMEWYDALQPFGTAFEAPLIRLDGVKIQRVMALKGGHFKLVVASASGDGLSGTSTLEAIWFGPPSDHPGHPSRLQPNATVGIMVEPQWNYFRGRKTLQLLIRDLKKTVAFESEG